MAIYLFNIRKDATMQKILPNANPIITHSPPVAYLSSILGNNPATYSWLMNHYVNIYVHNGGYFDNFYDRCMFYHGCPWLQVVQIRREIVLNICKKITDYVKTLLEKDFYVYALANVQYIEAYGRDQYYGHNFLIYGYDDDKQEFLIADFFNRGRYGTARCSYDKIEMALQTAHMEKDFVNLIYGVKLKNIDYTFEINMLSEMLKEQIESTNLFYKYNTCPEEEYYSNKSGNDYHYFGFEEMKTLYSFGLSFYDQLNNMIISKPLKVLRPIDLIYEHKIMMEHRVDYLMENRYISEKSYLKLKEKIEFLRKSSLLTRNLYLKHLMRPERELINKIPDQIEELKMLDQDFSISLLNAL